MQVEVFKTLHMLEHDIVYVDNTPALMAPVAYAHQDFLHRLDNQTHVVKLYPSIPGGQLLQEHTTFLLREGLILEFFKKTELRRAKECIVVSYQWFERNSIYTERVEAQVEVVPGFDVKPMY